MNRSVIVICARETADLMKEFACVRYVLYDEGSFGSPFLMHFFLFFKLNVKVVVYESTRWMNPTLINHLLWGGHLVYSWVSFSDELGAWQSEVSIGSPERSGFHTFRGPPFVLLGSEGR